jgi:two-component system sensor histidine kinase KdpD
LAIASKTEAEATRRAGALRRAAGWLLIAAVTTAALWVLRGSLDKAHVALAFLLVVLVGSARDGRLVGLLLSITCFLTFNFFLLPPLYALKLADPLDWGVLLAFLATGGIAAELLHRQQLAANLAERRAREMDRLAGLVAESLSVGRAMEAVEAITRVIRSELDIETCDIIGIAKTGISPPAGVIPQSVLTELVSQVQRKGGCVTVGSDGRPRTATSDVPLASLLVNTRDLREVLVALSVRGRTLGVLRLADPEGIQIKSERARFAEALTYYAALAAERVHLEAEAERVEPLREADRLKDALLATVSHDLRTPLTTIRAAAGELRLAGQEQGELIEREADHLNTLVTDLLDLSRLRAGKLPLSIELNAAEDLVGAALQRLRGVAGADAILVHLPRNGTIPVGRFDFTHSLRALTNLVENALRHSTRPGSVEVRVDRAGDHLLFEVADEGPGVFEADEPHLFEPFFRSAGARAARGTGLGLAIARRVAEAQGGSVEYQRREGGGSVFTLRLPATDLDTVIDS